ncbi:unnamed protein product [Rhizoctonia solani]|uniref:CCHC-type domain-containing protein n=1 Tax=Rhizoctonia solani TaxID=456999 RepID=A0A8H3AVT0_9AGAM|nr:unnamed protein product [Rhizoctonia solani]
MSESFTPVFLHRIPHLDGVENYNTWRVQMEDILTDLDLLKYVDRTYECPAEGKSEDAKTEHKMWLKNDRKALTNIRLRVTEKVIMYIQSSTRSTEAWDLLESLFQVKGKVGLIDLRRKFFSHRMAEDDELEEHIQKMRTWYQQINDIAPSSCTEADWITTLVASLPDSWGTFAQAIDFKFDLEDKNKLANQVSDIRARIIAEAHYRNTRGGAGQMFLTKIKSRHNKSECTHGNYRQKSHRQAKSDSQCYNCGRYGHWATDCSYTSGRAHESSGSSTDESESEESPDEESDSRRRRKKCRDCPHTRTQSPAEMAGYLFMATDRLQHSNELVNQYKDAWIADSGTTTHVTNNRDVFIDFKPVDGLLTGVAGEEPIIRRGTVLLRCQINSKRQQFRNITLTNVAYVPKSPTNLISLSAVTDQGHRVVMQGDRIKICSRSNSLIASGRKEVNFQNGNLWKINCQVRKLLVPELDATAGAPTNPNTDTKVNPSTEESPNSQQYDSTKETQEISRTGEETRAGNCESDAQSTDIPTETIDVESAPDLATPEPSDTLVTNRSIISATSDTDPNSVGEAK